MSKLSTTITILGLICLTPLISHAELCGSVYKSRTRLGLELYPVILSSDLTFLTTEAQFAEGPSPQKNMSTSDDQFRINDETENILNLKKRITARFRDKVLAIQKGHEAEVALAAREQFALMLEELPVKSPADFRREGDTLINISNGDHLAQKDLENLDAKSALEKVGQMVPDDLILMHKAPNGSEFQLIGGYLSFPTRWSIDGALGWSITQIHENVGSDPEKRALFSAMINRVLAKTLEGKNIVRRNNWFIELDPRYPLPNYSKTTYKEPKRIDERNYRTSVFVRAERQTLRGLPQSQVVVFAIQPFIYSIDSILADPIIAANLQKGIAVKLLPEGAELPHFIRTLHDLIAKALQK